MARNRNVPRDQSLHEIHPAHRARLSDTPGVDSNRFGARIAALSCASLRSSGFRSAEYGDVRCASVGGDDRGDGFDAERNGTDDGAGFRVEYGKCVVGRKRNDGDATAVRAGPRGDGRCASHVVTECGGIPVRFEGVAVRVGGDGGQVCGDRLSHDRLAGNARRRVHAPDGRHEWSVRDRIDGDGVDARRAVHAHSSNDAIGAPVEPPGGVRCGDPDFAARATEAHACHLAGEDALDAGG